MCFKVAEMNTSPLRWESNYVLFGGMVVNLSRDMDIQALCPDCAHIVGDFIKSNRKNRKHLDLCQDSPKVYYEYDDGTPASFPSIQS